MRTSRIGRKPVTVPTGVDVKIHDGQLTVKGSKGQLSMPLHQYVVVTHEDGHINVNPNRDASLVLTGQSKKTFSAIAGTIRAKIANLVHGVSQGFEKKLTMVGVGYRAQSKGKVLALSLGFSHPTDYNVPEGVTIETPTQTEIVIKGADKQKVGLVASEIREIRPPEPYKGKGVRYANEVVEIKETKKK